MDIAQLRNEYTKKKLSKKSVFKNPMEQFSLWLEEAIEAKCPEPTAMVISTVSEENTPSARVVLLKGIEEGCPVFFTNYLGRKGIHLSKNSAVSALFFWQELERQVSIEGTVEKCSKEYSDAYFRSRPWKSRIGAIISPQSRAIASRSVIKKAFVLEAAKHIGDNIPRPEHWGGYMIRPSRIEFWQGRENRLHDRVLFEKKEADSWEISRLAP